ncbi:MAG: F0F1 ATP synthase subunit gamma [Simplicispira suum]|uniref:F0F1 ATP synthase subunit gamma n=1 Tax=Simplicispira suum TaxID=2109915 RepID=UPI001C6D0146|nr:F0F1 ATP synthase subunit gamma [Simplicispira suum]MBW7831868.1 F0F1 ATP synthase subunit gamma [Simplicispira suum]
MNRTAAEVQARLATTQSFGGLVSALRGMAAARTERARTRIAGADAYSRTVAAAIGQALALLPANAAAARTSTGDGSDDVLWLVFGAEQGFNGGYTERVLDALPTTKPTTRIVLLGEQAKRIAHVRRLPIEAHAPLVAHAGAVIPASERLRSLLLDTLARKPAASVELLFGELGAGNHFELRRQRLLPLDLDTLRAAPAQAPRVHQPPAELLHLLAGEYVTARLARAVLHSHAVENLARLSAMAAAQENVAKLGESLQAELRQLRQEAITAEVVELAAGLRSLRARSDEATGP